MPIRSRVFVLVAAVATVLFAAPMRAEVINVRELELRGLATVAASRWDLGHKDNLFDRNWQNLYRSAAINPAVITVEFVNPQTTGAARAKFSHAETHDWTLEAADTIEDLENRTGSYVNIFGPVRVTGPEIKWREWNDTPVTRRIYRFTVRRITGDNYVHIHELELQTPEPIQLVWIGGKLVRVNVIEITPEQHELPLGWTLQYRAEASLSYGPNRYDVTELASWGSTSPGVATVSRTGLAEAVGVGSTTIIALLGVVHAEAPLSVRTPRPPDLDAGFVHRTPQYNRFKVSFLGDQHIEPGYENEKKWPDPGELVTYTAHVFNKGDQAATGVVYHWYFDEQLVGHGTIPLMPGQSGTEVSLDHPWPADTVQQVSVPPGAMTLHPKQLQRAIGDHVIRLELDPLDAVAESCEINNAVQDYINALTFWVFMDETTYALFNKHTSFLESYSAEDWARMQLIGLERRLRVSGCQQRLRLDMLAVYPDGSLNPGGVHAPIGDEVRQADGRWGFQIGEWPEPGVERFAKIVQNPLMHEWGHQIGLIDVYQYDIATNNCLITRGGQRVAGTSLMPLVSPWNVFYGNMKVMHAGGQALTDYSARALMADPAARSLSPGSAAGMTRNLGLRRGFFGDYLGAIQQGTITLKVQHHGGAPVPGCQIRVFQRALDTTVPDNPKFTGQTDAEGEWIFPNRTEPGWQGGLSVNNPWSYVENSIYHKAPDPVGRNVPLVIELEFAGIVEYHFVEVDELNVAMGGGVIDNYTITLTTYESRKSNRLPVISFNGAPGDVYLDEGQTFVATITATDADGDPVTLRATPLANSAFDPETGRFTFTPDSLQVNRHGAHVEWMSVTFVADDGKFPATMRMRFFVADIGGAAKVNEPGVRRFCPPDLTRDGALDIFDFLQFQDFFVAQDPRADFDRSTGPMVFDLFDFLAFQNAFVGGCP